MLRDYQEQVIVDLRRGFMSGHKRQVVALPTGAGKTHVAAQIIQNASERGTATLFIVDRRQLVWQAVDRFSRHGLRVGVLQGDNTNYCRDDDVVVATIQSIGTRSAPDWVRLVIVDECHNVHRNHIRLMEHWSALPVIGLSATPLNPVLGKLYSNLVRGPTIRELIALGHLVPARGFAPSPGKLRKVLGDVRVNAGDFVAADLGKKLNTRTVIGDVLKTWQEKAADRQTLVFAIDIAHSKALAEEFIANGVLAAHLDHKADEQTRHETIQAFREGRIQVLVSVALLSIGFDAPEASCAVLARPTLSEMLHVQQVGRVLRPAEGKADALILDHAGNLLRFGMPEEFVVDALPDPEPKRKKKGFAQELPAPRCKECGAVMEAGVLICPECGTERRRKPSDVVAVYGKLHKYGIDAEDMPLTEEERVDMYRQFVGFAVERQFKPGYAWRAWKKLIGDDPPCRRLPDPLPPRKRVRAMLEAYYERERRRFLAIQRKTKKYG